ncbi:autotransporter domain-containing protein [Rhodopseudomonas sp. BR0G17]|uniref:autotransporter outer membrane beta-barrel domain-containing protein n=1 Tax=Rhodopseudomonas sp. BR0G17 TaxID=2269368 RepID=UPI0013DF9452|nr:autotransporter domain-containing protein [Rhodopseudomonas sp. BR0G17]NEW97439.1 autotransporter domain-containing protein [Rhodopseudomonas sp. BR0G17]
MKKQLLLTTSLAPLLAVGVLGSTPALADCTISGNTTGLTCSSGSISSSPSTAVTVGDGAGANGSVTLSGAGASWTDTNEVSVGRDGGVGSINVSNGASLTTRRLGLSTATWQAGSGGNGSLVVTGPQTVWTSTGGIDIARTAGATGSLTISNGAAAYIRSVGIYTGAGAEVTIRDAGTHVEIGDPTNSSAAAWLSPSGGTVNVLNGAYLYASGIYVGPDGSNLTTMNISGRGTKVDIAERIYVGGQNGGRNVDPMNGNGVLNVTDGALVTSGTVGAGMDPLSQGIINVSGSGTRLWAKANPTQNILGNVYAGFNGNGTVVVSNGAELKADNEVRIGYDTQGQGVLAIGAASGQAAAAPGTITVSRIVFGSGTGQLVFNHTSSNYTLASDIIGNGSIQAIAGRTTLTGDSSQFTGTMQVSGGILTMTGVIGAVMAVESGAVLTGSGTVGGVDAQAGATVAPGNSPGTLTVTGNYQQAAGSTYNAELVPGSTVSDRIAVGGTATLAPGAILKLTKYGAAPYALDARYTVLTAAGGVNGTYVLTGDTSVSAFYSLIANYDPNNVYLQAVQTRGFTEVALTANQRATAGVLQAMGSGGGLRAGVAASPTDAAARAAFDQLSGEAFASAKTALLDDSRFVREATSQQVQSALRGPDTAVWARAYGSWAKADGNGNAADVRRNAGGVLFGADGELFNALRLGVVGGYGSTSINLDGGRGSVSGDTYSIGVYGGRAWNALALSFGANHAWHNLSSTRTIALTGFADRLTADYNARTTQVYGDVGYTVELGRAALQPFAGLAYVSLDTSGFTERGGAAALRSAGDNVDATFSTLGLRANGALTLGTTAVTANGMVGWRHTMNSVIPTATNAFATGNAFTVSGLPLAKDVAVFEAGLGTALNPSTALSVNYSGQVGSSISDHGVRANLRVTF